jgi:hypothetical protein
MASQPIIPESTSGFDSRDCTNVVVDLVGDQTVRPLRASLREIFLAERDRRARLLAEIAANQRAEQSPS